MLQSLLICSICKFSNTDKNNILDILASGLVCNWHCVCMSIRICKLKAPYFPHYSFVSTFLPLFLRHFRRAVNLDCFRCGKNITNFFYVRLRIFLINSMDISYFWSDHTKTPEYFQVVFKNI